MLAVSPRAMGLTPRSFEVAIEERPAETVVKAFGEIDLASAPRLTEILHRVARYDAPVRLDLAGIEFIDSSGLHAMQTASRSAERLGRSLTFEPLSAAVTRTVALAGFEPARAL